MKSNYKEIGELIEKVDERNVDGSISTLVGVSIEKCFIKSVANTIGTDLTKYKVIRRNEFAVSLMQVSRDEKIPVARLADYDSAIMSPAYPIFKVKDANVILPEYLDMWFKRSEFDREASFIAVGGVRGSMPYEEFCRMKVLVPPIEKQRNIVKAYKTITDRIALKQRINENLAKQCSIDYVKTLKGYTTEDENLPPSWRKGNIGDYCDVKSGYAFKSEWWTDKGYKVIKIANISKNSVELDECDCVQLENAVKAQNFMVQSGDLLIAMTGATIGKIGLVPLTSEKIVVNQRVGKFFLGNHPIEKVPFLFSTLLYSKVACYLQPDGTAGSAQDNLSADDIKNISIVMPDEKTILDFNNYHIPHIKTIINNNAEIRRLKSMLDIMLQILSSR